MNDERPIGFPNVTRHAKDPDRAAVPQDRIERALALLTEQASVSPAEPSAD